MKLESDGGDLL